MGKEPSFLLLWYEKSPRASARRVFFLFWWHPTYTAPFYEKQPQPMEKRLICLMQYQKDISSLSSLPSKESNNLAVTTQSSPGKHRRASNVGRILQTLVGDTQAGCLAQSEATAPASNRRTSGFVRHRSLLLRPDPCGSRY